MISKFCLRFPAKELGYRREYLVESDYSMKIELALKMRSMAPIAVFCKVGGRYEN